MPLGASLTAHLVFNPTVRSLLRKRGKVKRECDLSTTKVTVARVTVAKVTVAKRTVAKATVAKVTVAKAIVLLRGRRELCHESDGDLIVRNLKQFEVCNVRVRM